MDIKEELWRQGLDHGVNMRFSPLGGSMVPTLRQGDVVTIKPGQGCRIGDLILFERGAGLVLHRVVAKLNGAIFTKGDALPYRDAMICPQDILGKAISRERRGKERPLDSLTARLLGLAFCLTSACVPGSMKILAAVKRLGREKLGLTFRQAN
jgi:hypothetical protein